MSRETSNLGLILYDPSEDKDVKVRDLINKVLGFTDSNTIKIDAKTKDIDTNIKTLHDSIIGTDGNVVFYNKQEVLLAVHPVGSIFLSTDGTEPAELYGGTWEQIKDVFLLGASNTYPVKSTGGEATHKLTESELPNITGEVEFQSDGNSQGVLNGANGAFKLNQMSLGAFYPNNRRNEDGTARRFKMSFGSDLPHNNMPPYYSVYIWRRVA